MTNFYMPVLACTYTEAQSNKQGLGRKEVRLPKYRRCERPKYRESNEIRMKAETLYSPDNLIMLWIQTRLMLAAQYQVLGKLLALHLQYGCPRSQPDRIWQ